MGAISRSQLALIVAGGALLAPWLTWFPMLAFRWPSLALGVWFQPPGAWHQSVVAMALMASLALVVLRRSRLLAGMLALYAADVLWTGPLPLFLRTTAKGAQFDPIQGIIFWDLQALWFTAIFTVAAWLWSKDRWLGAFVTFAAIGVFLHGMRLNLVHLVLLTFGAVLLVTVRNLSSEWRGRVALGLGLSGFLQALYMLQQMVFNYDLLWGPMLGGVLNARVQPLGTLGTVDAASAYVAITAPLMPWWAQPFAVAAVLGGRSYGAILALGLGLVVRYWALPRWGLVGRQALASALLVGFSGAGLYVMAYKGLGTVTGRLAIQRFALADLWQFDPIAGFGLSGWIMRIPQRQIALGVRPNGELWLQAHSEYLQVLYELGLAGLLMVGAWAWSHRARLGRGAWGGAVTALALSCTSFFTFHVAATALLGVTILGLSTAEPDPEPLGG